MTLTVLNVLITLYVFMTIEQVHLLASNVLLEVLLYHIVSSTTEIKSI